MASRCTWSLHLPGDPQKRSQEEIPNLSAIHTPYPGPEKNPGLSGPGYGSYPEMVGVRPEAAKSPCQTVHLWLNGRK